MTQAAPAAQAAPKKKGLAEMNGVVICLQETHDTWSLDIQVGDNEF